MVILSVTLLSVAAVADAATLTVRVSPTTVHPNVAYTITIAGRYDRHALHRTPSLLAFIQYTGAACRSTAAAEYALPVREWNWVFFPQRAEPHSSFKAVFYEQARTRLGERRVCAYLYPARTSPQTKARALARAGALFTNVGGRRSSSS